MSATEIYTDLDAAAVAGIRDSSTVLIGGFGQAGMPVELIDALIGQGAGDLTVVGNNAGNGDTGLAALLAKGRVRKVICSFPRQPDSWVFDGSTGRARSSSRWFPRAIWPSASGRPVPASAESMPHRSRHVARQGQGEAAPDRGPRRCSKYIPAPHTDSACAATPAELMSGGRDPDPHCAGATVSPGVVRNRGRISRTESPVGTGRGL